MAGSPLDPFLKIDMTFARRQSSGTMPSASDLLNRSARTGYSMLKPIPTSLLFHFIIAKTFIANKWSIFLEKLDIKHVSYVFFLNMTYPLVGLGLVDAFNVNEHDLDGIDEGLARGDGNG